MLNILNNEKGPFQVLFGDDASVSSTFVVPIIFIVIVVLFILAMRIIFNSKGRSQMTEEELKADQKLVDARMSKQAEFAGEEYVPELARAKEQEEINEAKRRYGRD